MVNTGRDPDGQEPGSHLLPSQAFDFLCSEFWFGLIMGFGLGWLGWTFGGTIAGLR